MLALGVILAIAGPALKATTNVPAPPRYTATDLGAGPDPRGRIGREGTWGTELGINDRGQVVGSHASPQIDEYASEAALWEKGKVRLLGAKVRDYPAGGATAVNGRGLVVGILGRGRYTGPGSDSTRAFLWERGRTRVLEGVRGHAMVSAVAINEPGEIVGTSQHMETGGTDPVDTRALLWRRDGTWTELGTLGGIESHATDINDLGQVVGISDTKILDRPGLPVWHPFVWEKGKMRDLGTLPGGEVPYAAAINNRGQIVGSAEVSRSPLGVSHFRACRWDGAGWRFLEELPAAAQSVAHGINDVGQIVGTATIEGPGPRVQFDPATKIDLPERTQRAILWQGGRAYDLNDLVPKAHGWRLEEANAINGRGQIVGLGTRNGKPRAFLLTPTP